MPALITAFNADGSIDEAAHSHNVSVAASAGASGLLIAGSTGEGPYLEADERRLLTAAARASHPNLTILCGIAADTDRQATAQIAEAHAGGADAALVVTPGALVRDRHGLIIDFYRRIADAAPLPILLYTVPRVTGYELPVDSIRELAGHANVVGMKDSGGNPFRLDELSDILASGFVAYAGASRSLADSAEHGAHGAITASSNYAWNLADAASSGDRRAQAMLVEITAAIEPHGVVGTKFAAGLIGMHPGRARLPLLPLGQPAQEQIRRAISDFRSRPTTDN